MMKEKQYYDSVTYCSCIPKEDLKGDYVRAFASFIPPRRSAGQWAVDRRRSVLFAIISSRTLLWNTTIDFHGLLLPTSINRCEDRQTNIGGRGGEAPCLVDGSISTSVFQLRSSFFSLEVTVLMFSHR